MILTVTMNPSVDTRYQLDELIIDDVNRVTPERPPAARVSTWPVYWVSWATTLWQPVYSAAT